MKKLTALLLAVLMLALPEESDRNHNQVGGNQDKRCNREGNRIVCRASSEADETDHEEQHTESNQNDILFIHQY